MTKRRPLPDADYLRSLFTYEPETGMLRWKVKRSNKEIGWVAGCRRGSEYWQVGIDDKLYRVHLVAWKIVTGKEPPNFIDHEDTDKGNNRWVNLREATKSQNQANIGLLKHNTSGVKGVRWYKAYQKWSSQFTKNGKCYFVGYFDDLEEAKAAYQKRYREVYGEFARFE